MVDMYRKKWRRSYLRSCWGYLRDVIINYLPIKRLPLPVRRFLYKGDINFIFFVHPRTEEDIFVALPIVRFFKKVIPEEKLYRFFSFFPPFVIETLYTQEVKGVVIASFWMPEVLAKDRKASVAEAKRAVKFIEKISAKGTYIALAGWWPMVTGRGIAIETYCKQRNTYVTTGHCATLVSLVSTVEKIAKINDIKMVDLNIAIIGTGKMGTAVAKALYGRIKHLLLIDTNGHSLTKIVGEFNEYGGFTRVRGYNVHPKEPHWKQILESYHLAVCTTSNIQTVMDSKDIPDAFIILDDSRPEAINRETGDKRKVILEGGLIKIKGICLEYDYGFGMHENVFGCLAEGFILAADKTRELKPTVGDIDIENFKRMSLWCKMHNIEIGDFMSRDQYVSEALIREIVEKRKEKLAKETRVNEVVE